MKGNLAHIRITGNSYNVVARGCVATTSLQYISPDDVVVARGNGSIMVHSIVNGLLKTLKGHRCIVRVLGC